MPTSLNRINALPPSELQAVTRIGNIVMVGTMACSALAALVIGNYYSTLSFALMASGCLTLLGNGAFLLGQEAKLSSYILVFCDVALVALHVQLGRGTIEFHFGVFVLLGLLLVYRDWRPIVFGSALFAIHHIVFDRLQAMGLGCTAHP